MALAKKGDTVKVNYTGSLPDGTVFDSSTDQEPLQFLLGSGEVIAGFDEAVMGMQIGESKQVTIPVAKAYGPRNDEMVVSVSRQQVPPDLNPEVGQKLEMGGPGGELLLVEVIEVTDEHIRLDANPPLAGKDLIFDIELVAIS